ncbi:hydrogenase iron-sulfur subunit [bacterium]|nr:hydrogenase iron-sulfur subunit [bacterium]
MDKKIGAYICTGCGIGEALDVEKLVKVASSKVAECKTHQFLCGQEGLSVIKQDIADGVNVLVVAACSRRAKPDTFLFEATIVERVDLREQVIWSHKPNDEDTQAMAEDYLRMGMVKVQKASLPQAYLLEEISKTILVVGGGISGITASLEAAKAGYEVVLVEKDPQLGGYMTKLAKQLPAKPPYQELEEPDIEERIKEIEANDKIGIFAGARIEKTSGQPGEFEVTIARNGGRETVKVGSIVLAAGFVPYDAAKLGHLGYGKYKNVITNTQMEEMAKEGKIRRPSDNRSPKSVLFVQCAGSRDKDHLPYCSTVCCRTSLKQATYIREQDDEASAYIIYKDIRTPGLAEDFYSKVQEDEGIFLTKGEIGEIAETEGNNLIVEATDTLLGEKIKIEAEMVVLATGMVPAAAVGTEIEEEVPEGEKKPETPPDTIIKSDILNLNYRQGPEPPALKYGFPDSHFICFPYETRRTGIYAAGCIRSPMDKASSMTDATGAALKAIQCIELTAQGKAVHPRVSDMTYPDLFMQRCTQCKRCTEECPFGAYDEDEKFNPVPNPARCRRCGTCLGSCPERIISFADFSIDIIASQIKIIDIPEEDEEKPRVLCFVCENDALPALDMAARKRLKLDPAIRIIPLRCLGSINLVWITDALSAGFDGILLFGCKHGDDYQCHFVKGSELANYRIPKVQETLDRLRLESDRIEIHQLSIDEYDRLPEIFANFMEKIEEVGPNPFKDF